MDAENAPRSKWWTFAFVVIVVEAALIGVLAVVNVIFVLNDFGSGVYSSWLYTVAGGIAAVGLGLLARGLLQARRWAISPAITWQILLGLSGAYLVSVGDYMYGPAALVAAIVGLVPLVQLAKERALAG
ncbi:hypothetical protein [Demequina sp.]|uniref:hypothetical protein n=1 Tax=Demequina sp. TaxID=2050685 RepID=UPI003D10CABD